MGASPIDHPNFTTAHMMKRRIAGLQNRLTRCKSGVRVIPSNSPVAQAARASDFDSEGDGASPSGATTQPHPTPNPIMLNSRDVSDRRILAAARELISLQQRRYTIRDLEEPYQRGWRRDYVLSQRSREREDRPVLEAILAVIGSTIVRPDRSFQSRQGRTRALCEISQPLRPISNNEWNYKGYPALWIRYFRYELRLQRNNHWQPYWIFVHTSLYHLKVSRNMIHQVRDIDPDVERRIGELDRWFETHDAWPRYRWLRGSRMGCHWRGTESPKQKLTNKRHRQEIARAYEIFPEVDPAASVWRIPTSLRPIFLLPA